MEFITCHPRRRKIRISECTEKSLDLETISRIAA